MNANERPEGFLLPQLAPPPAGVRPFISRRHTPAVKNPNHVAVQPLTDLRSLPDDWCYRCNAPGHRGEYACWVPIRPIPTDQAVKVAAMAARAAAAVPQALASWTPEHDALMVAVASELLAAVDSSREARRALADRDVWTRAGEVLDDLDAIFGEGDE